jgi:hypothetical protein
VHAVCSVWPLVYCPDAHSAQAVLPASPTKLLTTHGAHTVMLLLPSPAYTLSVSLARPGGQALHASEPSAMYSQNEPARQPASGAPHVPGAGVGCGVGAGVGAGVGDGVGAVLAVGVGGAGVGEVGTQLASMGTTVPPSRAHDLMSIGLPCIASAMAVMSGNSLFSVWSDVRSYTETP